MAHIEQYQWCEACKHIYKDYFNNKDVLDVGSQDINGSNKLFFENCNYIGLDIGPGKNVDVVCKIHEYYPDKQFDTIISTEMLEHDENFDKSLKRMLELLKNNGLLVLTAAGHERPEHGTTNHSPVDSPFTSNYYKNIYSLDLINSLDPENNFSKFTIDYIPSSKDIRFVGIKK
jgi:SAM-dependent methyltransferase